MALQKVPALLLPSGKEFPMIGLGTWKSKPGDVAAAVEHALKVGYRHVDGAAIYGNEKEVGEGIRIAMDKYGIKREDIFVTSKLWNTKHCAEDVEPALKQTLSDLGLTYLDLYLMHWPIAFQRGEDVFPKNEDGTLKYDGDVHPTETYLEMQKLVKKGLTKDIGLSNFNSAQIQDILDKAEIKPATNQVEAHPYFNQSKLLSFCRDRGICLTAYSPLGSPTRPWASPDEPSLLESEAILEIAKKYSKTSAQVLLRWQIQRGLVVIPKSVTPSRIEENFDIFNFELSAEDTAKIDALDMGPMGRLVCPKGPNDSFRDEKHPHFPFKIEF